MAEPTRSNGSDLKEIKVLTVNEMKVLKSLAYNDYGEGHATWSWAVNESKHPSGIKGKALSGVVASLVKKGLLKAEGEGEDSSISTTEAGIAEMKKNGWYLDYDA